MIGRVIGNYRITGAIGSGGMGDVFIGEDLMLERPVAVKRLKPELTGRPDVVQRFRSEAVVLAQLHHTNIATVYAFLQDGAHFFLVMEYVRGWTWQNLIGVHGAFAPAVAVGLFRQALDGIGFAHRQRIIHRDLKPANIMVTESGVIKVMDFGLARVLGSAHLTRTGRLVGTLEYISPEQIRGEETDTRSDIYALGIVLYELVTGCLPFVSDSEYTLVRAQVEAPPPSPRAITPAVSPALEQVILRALAKTPGERFQSIAEFSRALDRCVPQTEAHDALSALLPVLQRHACEAELPKSQSQNIRQAAQPAAAAAQAQTTRLAKAVDRRAPKPLYHRLTQTWKGYLVPAFILASSVAAVGLLFLLGMPDTPGDLGPSPTQLSEAVLPPPNPLLVAPQPDDQRMKPLDQPREVTPSPAQPQVQIPDTPPPTPVASVVPAQRSYERASVAVPAATLRGRGVRIPAQGAEDWVREVSAFRMDLYPVSNRDFLDFVATHPQWKKSRIASELHDGDYLKHWQGDETIAPEELDRPVSYVSYYAAAAYCSASGKRLPGLHHFRAAAQHLPLNETKMSIRYDEPYTAPDFHFLDTEWTVTRWESEQPDSGKRVQYKHGSVQNNNPGSAWYSPEVEKRSTGSSRGFRCVVRGEPRPQSVVATPLEESATEQETATDLPPSGGPSETPPTILPPPEENTERKDVDSETPPVVLPPPEGDTERKEVAQDIPPQGRKGAKQTSRRASALTTSPKGATKGSSGWYIRK
jgi:serine/threonine-protein kinase